MGQTRNFGFLLRDVSRRYVNRFEHRAREISLTLPQCKVLVRLDKNEGVSQARLAELAQIEPMTMVRILDRMERDGWLERRPDPDDRRARRLYLSKRASPLLGEIWRLADLTLAETFAGISNARRDAFISLLQRIHDNVCALDRAVGVAQDAAGAPPARSKPKAKARARKTSSRVRR